jgi:hypothetical protein
LMSILLPIFLAGATLTGAPSNLSSPRAELTPVSAPRPTLRAAASAAALRESPRLDRQPGRALPKRPSARRSGRNSVLTRATAIFAGAVIGSFAGFIGGATIDAATSNGECLTFATYGMPIGAGLGGFLTARLVR